MTNNKLNKIKFNIITIILTLLCISCAVNTLDPKVNSYTNTKEDNENLENGSQDIKPSNQKSQEKTTTSQEKTTTSKLEAIGKKLEAQAKKEKEEMERLNTKDYNFTNTLDNGELHFLEQANSETKMQIKRMLYSSLDYNTDEIKKLQEILDKIIEKSKGWEKDLALTALLQTAGFIQAYLDDYLEIIQIRLDCLNQKELEDLIIHAEHGLKLKKEFATQLKETVKELKNKVTLDNNNFVWNISDLIDLIRGKYLKFYSIVSDVEYKKTELNK
ncbi:complement regulator-acquiring protein (plasmid) [Borrelia sp. CA_690]|uniref:complement regulator-acquiring protein n=1 Tax=Borrelia TaxID=138 RepID=UPI00165ED262|nr:MULTISPECIES: complement regulator-acquiring protein [Borrelia]WKC84010.1 complement regulator-acquiring protein [Borrelia sp. CA_690]